MRRLFCVVFSKGFGQNFLNFQKTENLKIKPKPWRVGPKCTFPCCDLGPTSTTETQNLKRFFVIEKPENSKKICKKSKQKARSTKERFPRPIFDDFQVILGSFLRPNGVKKPKKSVTIFQVKKGVEKNYKKSLPRPNDTF